MVPLLPIGLPPGGIASCASRFTHLMEKVASQVRSAFLSTVAVASLLVTVILSGAETGPAKWENDVRAFEQSDRTNPPPPNASVFVGSSSIRLWKSLPLDFKEFSVVNRGFGGSELSDSVALFDRLVLPYRPRLIVLYAGDNDLAEGKSPARICADWQAFVKKARAALPKVFIAYIAIKPSPARSALLDKSREANGLIAAAIRKDARLAFVDVFTPMLGPDGQPRPELFQADKLHLNSRGYELWISALRPLLEKHGTRVTTPPRQ